MRGRSLAVSGLPGSFTADRDNVKRVDNLGSPLFVLDNEVVAPDPDKLRVRDMMLFTVRCSHDEGPFLAQTLTYGLDVHAKWFVLSFLLAVKQQFWGSSSPDLDK
jgi:hypothetical protein